MEFRNSSAVARIDIMFCLFLASSIRPCDGSTTQIGFFKIPNGNCIKILQKFADTAQHIYAHYYINYKTVSMTILVTKVNLEVKLGYNLNLICNYVKY